MFLLGTSFRRLIVIVRCAAALPAPPSFRGSWYQKLISDTPPISPKDLSLLYMAPATFVIGVAPRSPA